MDTDKRVAPLECVWVAKLETSQVLQSNKKYRVTYQCKFCFRMPFNSQRGLKVLRTLMATVFKKSLSAFIYSALLTAVRLLIGEIRLKFTDVTNVDSIIKICQQDDG